MLMQAAPAVIKAAYTHMLYQLKASYTHMWVLMQAAPAGGRARPPRLRKQS